MLHIKQFSKINEIFQNFADVSILMQNSIFADFCWRKQNFQKIVTDLNLYHHSLSLYKVSCLQLFYITRYLTWKFCDVIVCDVIVFKNRFIADFSIWA